VCFALLPMRESREALVNRSATAWGLSGADIWHGLCSARPVVGLLTAAQAHSVDTQVQIGRVVLPHAGTTMGDMAVSRSARRHVLFDCLCTGCVRLDGNALLSSAATRVVISALQRASGIVRADAALHAAAGAAGGVCKDERARTPRWRDRKRQDICCAGAGIGMRPCSARAEPERAERFKRPVWRLSPCANPTGMWPPRCGVLCCSVRDSSPSLSCSVSSRLRTTS
jgi:hypothetical protein